MNALLVQFLRSAWAIAIDSAPWVLLSLAIGGLIREFLPTSRLRPLLTRPGYAGMTGAVILGALLPICSCGVIPLAVSLYRARVRLGPVMAFTAATPIINPAAVILALGLLGPQITLAYIALGLLLPFLLGMISERWGERAPPDATTAVHDPLDNGARTTDDGAWRRAARGLRWGLLDLGPTIGYYLLIGIALAAVIATVVPPTWMHRYLGDGSWVGLLAIALLGAAMYVCAVAHIPLIAALLAAGVSPGASVVFLVTGAATNLPELITLYHAIGRRAVLLYTATLVVASLVAGALINAWLMPGFQPALDPLHSLELVTLGQSLQLRSSAALSTFAALLLLALALWGSVGRLRSRSRGGVAPAVTHACCKPE